MRPIAALLCAVAAVILAASWILLRHVKRHRHDISQDDLIEFTSAERELPDALLQNFQGVLLKVHAAAALFSEHPTEARRKLDDALAEADQTIAEARDTLEHLHPPDLVEDLLQLGSELGANTTDDDAPGLRVHLRGNRRTLSILASDEAHRIARETIRRVFDASRVDHVGVEMYYGARQFELLVRARGSDRNPIRLNETPADRYGLPVLRESVRLAGGQLTISNDSREGTEVKLSIPAPAAYVADDEQDGRR